MAETATALSLDPRTLEEIISQVIEPMASALTLLCEQYQIPLVVAYMSDDITLCSFRYTPERDNRLQVADMAVRSHEVESLIEHLAHHIQLVRQRH